MPFQTPASWEGTLASQGMCDMSEGGSLPPEASAEVGVPEQRRSVRVTVKVTL